MKKTLTRSMTKLMKNPVASLIPGLLMLSPIVTLAVPVNNAPTAINLSTNNFDENVPAPVTVALLSTDDLDLGDTHTYELVAGAGDADNAFFEISSNKLRALESFNFEGQNSLSVRIRTTDLAGDTFEQAFTITINNVNDLPLATPFSKVLQNDQTLTLNSTDFLAAYTDEDNDAMSDLQILTLPDYGTLTFNGSAVSIGDNIDVADLGLLVYTPATNFIGQESFEFLVRDGVAFAPEGAAVGLDVRAPKNAATYGSTASQGFRPNNGSASGALRTLVANYDAAVSGTGTGTSSGSTRPGSPIGYGTSNKMAGNTLLNIAGVQVNAEELPVAVFPNPMTQGATINFELAEAGTVRVRVFNLSGAEIGTPTVAHYEAGVHNLQWKPATELAAGQYLYQVEMITDKGTISANSGSIIKQ